MTSTELEVLDKSYKFEQTKDCGEEQTLTNGVLHPVKHSYRTALPQVLAASAKNLILFSYGMTLGFTTIVIPVLMKGEDETLTLTNNQIAWFGSINLICVPLGCLFSGSLTSRLGRKPMMLFVTTPMIAAWFIYYYAYNVTMLYTALVLTGLAGGLLEAPVLIYVAEITQPHLRGILSVISSLCVAGGIFVQLLLGTLLDWRTVAAVNVTFPVLAFIALCFVPESPYWLVGKGRLAEAERSLCCLRGWRQPSEVHVEYTALVSSLTASNKLKNRSSWRNYIRGSFLKPYLLVSAAFVISHVGGSTTLQIYAVTIFEGMGSPIDKYVATFYLGTVQLLASILCAVLVRWSGKRPLIFASSIGTGICFVVVATYAYTSSHTAYSVVGYEWIPLTFLLLVAFFSHVCVKHIPWVLIGEVYPNNVRSVAAAMSGSTGYVFNFAINYAYLSMVESMTLAGTFLFYAAVSLLGAVYMYYYCPETEGRTLIEIEEHFEGKISLLKSDVCCRRRERRLAR